MATTKNRALLRQIGTLFNLGTIGELTDGQLLERFARGDGEAAELAFGALVERHGAMVLRVCRSQSLDLHDAHDVFQATFLILVEKAPGLWVRDSLGPWLHRVAMRTASCARASAIRRRRLELRAAEEKPNRDESPEDAERLRLLHEEIERLPERYRVPIILCDLEGRTCEEAARVLGRPVGTIKSWRARGRERLRHRLIRAGLVPSAAAVLATAPEVARAMPAAEQAARALACILSDRMAAGTVPVSVSLLVKGVIRMIFYRQLRSVFTTVCALGIAGGGVASVAILADDHPKQGDAVTPPQPAPSDPPKSKRAERPKLNELTTPDSTPPRPPQIFASSKVLRGEAWPMSLRDAIRCAFENNGNIRVVPVVDSTLSSSGPPPIGIQRLRRRPEEDERFQSELMAVVRSVEQQYWNLVQAHVQLWAADRAVGLAREVYNREQAELLGHRGVVADVAEAAQRLGQFNLDLVTRTSDVITTERMLRNLLGLPAADNRRIIPTTSPTEAHLEPNEKKAIATMLEHQPDIRQARSNVEATERFLAAEKRAGNGRNAETDRLEFVLERNKAYLKQVINQTTYSLFRFLQETDGNYKQFESARRLRTAAAQRLDAQRAYYEEGRITLDRFFDGISQWSTAVATESLYLTRYNISIVALEESKGTLLDHEKIVVSTMPGAPDRVKASPDPKPTPAADPGPTAAAKPNAARKPEPSATTYSFHFTIGRGPEPMEIRGSITVGPARDAK